MVPHPDERNHSQCNMQQEEDVIKTVANGRERQDQHEREANQAHNTPPKPFLLIHRYISWRSTLDKFKVGESDSMRDELKDGEAGNPTMELVECGKGPARHPNERAVSH